MLKLILFVVLLAPVKLRAAGDTTIYAAIKRSSTQLYYPHEVNRFYQKTGYKLLWIAPDTVKTHTSDAMLLLDCVVQYGLAHQDYHATQLQYDELHRLIAVPANTDKYRKALYDIYLTDALICFINNLHYGRLNPDWTKTKIDRSNNAAFDAGLILLNALTQPCFKAAIVKVQPKSKAYRLLQYQMYTVTGLHTGDCYQTPQSEIGLMAINMERLRWVNETRRNTIDINIASQVLSLHMHNKIYRFKIKGVLPQHLPVSFKSFAMQYGDVVFNKPNTSVITTQEVKLQKINEQVVIPHGTKLAALLLNCDVRTNENRNYKLPVPLPLKFTYYTCEILQGMIVKYKDVYGLDKKMEDNLNK